MSQKSSSAQPARLRVVDGAGVVAGASEKCTEHRATPSAPVTFVVTETDVRPGPPWMTRVAVKVPAAFVVVFASIAPRSALPLAKILTCRLIFLPMKLPIGNIN